MVIAGVIWLLGVEGYYCYVDMSNEDDESKKTDIMDQANLLITYTFKKKKLFLL